MRRRGGGPSRSGRPRNSGRLGRPKSLRPAARTPRTGAGRELARSYPQRSVDTGGKAGNSRFPPVRRVSTRLAGPRMDRTGYSGELPPYLPTGDTSRVRVRRRMPRRFPCPRRWRSIKMNAITEFSSSPLCANSHGARIRTVCGIVCHARSGSIPQFNPTPQRHTVSLRRECYGTASTARFGSSPYGSDPSSQAATRFGASPGGNADLPTRAHSHTIMTRQPSRRRSATLRLSLSRLSPNFRSQKSRRVLGTVDL